MTRAALLLAFAACWSPERDLAECVRLGRCDPPDGGAAGGGTAGGGSTAGGSSGRSALPIIDDDGGTCVTSGTWSWPCVEAELAISEDAGALQAQAVIALWAAPAVSAPNSRWSGAVYTSQGEVMCLPYQATQALFIAPDGGMRLGPSSFSSPYSGGFWGLDGKVYGAPSATVDAPIVSVDPVTGQGMNAVLPMAASTGVARYCGVISDVTGRGWLIPYGADAVQRFAPPSSTTAFAAPVPRGADKWCAGSLLPDGRIFGMPQAQVSLLEIDPSDGGVRAIPIAISGARQISAVLARNGKLYGVPQGYTNSLELSPDGGARIAAALGANQHFNGGALAPDGRVVFVPESTQDVAVLSPWSGAVARTPTGQTGSLQWQGAATGRDGRVYACPFNSNQVLVIDPMHRRALPERVLLSPWFNKL